MAEFVRSLETLELVGGTLCLDFANTVNSRVNPEHEYLAQYSDVVGWATKLEILSPNQMNQLQKRAKQSEKEAEAAFAKSQRMRELLYRMFSLAAKGSEPDKKDMEMFSSSYAEAFSHAQFVRMDNHFKTTWNVGESFDALLWPIVHSAGELLLSEELDHVKECPSCGWLFLDTSKNQSRRWCSMNTCGARDKMRRYHKKQRTR
jgi:predicted RNA-binding Zn ribbon-like protein